MSSKYELPATDTEWMSNIQTYLETRKKSLKTTCSAQYNEEQRHACQDLYSLRILWCECIVPQVTHDG